jgi:hypothetical protein
VALNTLVAWSEISVLQHAPWLMSGVFGSHPAPGRHHHRRPSSRHQSWPKTILVDRRRHRDRDTRLLAIANGLLAAAEIGSKEHDRLALARAMMERKLDGRRTSSRLPALVELVIAKPLVSKMVAETLELTPQAARRIVLELGLREMTGRGSFRHGGFYKTSDCTVRPLFSTEATALPF